VRESGIHGKGVYAIRPIKAGDRYWSTRARSSPGRKLRPATRMIASQPNHTFYFHLDDGHVIDARHTGNSAKWINHSCEPNLEAESGWLPHLS
jgi:SET domain-containing protein